jgi:hypothetical protein
MASFDDMELFYFEDANKAKQMVFQIGMLFLEKNPERLTTIPYTFIRMFD